MTALTVEQQRLDLGRVITTTFGVLSRNLGVFAGLTVLLVGLPSLLVYWGMYGLIGDPGGNLVPRVGSMGVGFLVSIVTNAILQGALVYGAIRDLNGQRAGFGECLATGLRQMLPIIGVSFLMGLGVFFGFLALVVPGVILYVRWLVSIPALVAESAGVLGSMGRSAELTRGSRWRIFALLLIFLVLSWIAQVLLTPLLLVGVAGGPQALAIGQTVTNTITAVLYGLVGATGIAVIYAELRRLKEGMNPDALAALFD